MLDSVDVVLVWAPDGRTRRTAELVGRIDRLESTSTEVMTVRGGLIDRSTPGGRLQARLTGAVAEHESELKSERNRLLHAAVAAQGRPHGEGRPFGFAADRVTHRESEAAVLRGMAGRVVAGESSCSLMREWNARAVPTVSGAAWRVPTLRTQ